MTSATEGRYLIRDGDLLLDAPTSRAADNNYILRVKDLPDDEKPREKLLSGGPQVLSTAELVSILWGVGSRGEDVLAMARRTVQDYGEKAIGNELNAKRLAETADIPLVKACQVVAGFELGRRFYATSAGRPLHVRNAKQAFEYLRDMGRYQKEQLRGLYLGSRYQIIHDEVISVGSLTSNIVHPREVFQPAVERGAVAVIIAHNHPSGSLEPTMADLNVTEQLVAAGEVLGIELLDHLVIAGNKYASVLDFTGRP